MTERRARPRSGFEVELGLTTPAWASTTPVDPGTAGVVIGGCVPIVDPDGLLERLVATVQAESGHRRFGPT